MASSEHKLMVT